MIQKNLQTEAFKLRLRSSLQRESLNSRVLKVAKHANAYICGDNNKSVFCIESGQIKLSMFSLEGKECILAVYSSGDIFGESCLSGLELRMETATAMEGTSLIEVPCSKFFMMLSGDSLMEDFIKYLAVRIGEQQQIIANLITIDSEQRLGKTLLQLAQKLGKQDPRSILIEHKISHEELSEMVGTTRPRISMFMQRFRELGLIELSEKHFLIIKEKNLTSYLDRISC